MLRIIMTLLMCATFLILGTLGEQLLNLLEFALGKQEYLPGITLIIRQCFPLNCGFFLYSTLPFCAAAIVVLLASFQTPSLIPLGRFIDCNFVICLVFAFYYGVFLTGLVMPFHLLLTKMNPSFNLVNWCVAILTGVLVAFAVFLFVRMIWQKRKVRATKSN